MRPQPVDAELLPSEQLQVMDNFQADVNFWCIIHLSDMWGTLNLKRSSPSGKFEFMRGILQQVA